MMDELVSKIDIRVQAFMFCYLLGSLAIVRLVSELLALVALNAAGALLGPMALLVALEASSGLGAAVACAGASCRCIQQRSGSSSTVSTAAK